MNKNDLIFAEYLALVADHSEAVEMGSDEAVQMVRTELKALLKTIESELIDIVFDSPIRGWSHYTSRCLRLSNGDIYSVGELWLHKLKFYDTWTWTLD